MLALKQKNAAELLYRLYRHKADLLSKQGILKTAEEFYIKALTELALTTCSGKVSQELITLYD